MTKSLADKIDAVPFVGLAVANVHTGYNVSIELEPGCWSPQEFATSASEAILKCIAKHGPAPVVMPPPPYQVRA